MKSFNLLHLTNGTSTLNSLQQSGVPGDMFSADDILMEGPTTGGLRDDVDWEVRAGYLAYNYEIPEHEYLQGVAERLRRLEQCHEYDEVVLWFEEDLFCQVNLLYLLDWFARHDAAAKRLTLVCPVEERLGTLSPERLARLFEEREGVTAEKLALSRAAWEAYCAEKPTAIEELLQGDFEAWAMLKVGLQNHLRRFPSVHNGLNTMEQELLAQLGDEPMSFGQLFARIRQSAATAQYGIGDMQMAGYLTELGGGKQLLIRTMNFLDDDFTTWTTTRTETGREVAAGKRDWLQLKSLNRRLGGTWLSYKNIWRWDEEQGRLRRD